MNARTISSTFPTSCMVRSDHHSSDTVEVYHGYGEPAVGCGFHAFGDPHSLYSAHRSLMALSAMRVERDAMAQMGRA